MPYVRCPKDIDVDYIALYSCVGEYQKTQKTAVCFYQYDSLFDGIHGLFNAIYYDNKKLLEFYKSRFRNVKYIISPDYTQAGDANIIENLYRIFKTRIVSIWFVINLGIIVIPNVTYANKSYFEYMLDGMNDTEVVAFSLKGSLKNKLQKDLLMDAIKYTVDKLTNLSKIVVYSVSKDDNSVRKIFTYAKNKGIEIIIPPNSLMLRNKERGK